MCCGRPYRRRGRSPRGVSARHAREVFGTVKGSPCICIVVGAAVLLAAAPAPPIFTNIAKQAGIDMTPMNGASADKHLAETMGSGAVLFDADNDGWLDVFVVDGGSLVSSADARRARHRLFRN